MVQVRKLSVATDLHVKYTQVSTHDIILRSISFRIIDKCSAELSIEKQEGREEGSNHNLYNQCIKTHTTIRGKHLLKRHPHNLCVIATTAKNPDNVYVQDASMGG